MSKQQTNDMNCAQFQEIVHDLDRSGTQETGLREPALAHAESCSGCARIMTEAESLSFSLRTMADRDANQQAPLRVEAALMQEFRRVNVETTRRRFQARMAAFATAAVVFLAVGFSLWHPVLPVAKPAPAASVWPKETEPRGPAVAANSAAAASNASADRQSSASEYASAYVSLPYADDPSTLSGGAIVRVELSRPELAALGLPVTDMSGSDQILADVVLSEDGAPQAIRLVSQAATE